MKAVWGRVKTFPSPRKILSIVICDIVYHVSRWSLCKLALLYGYIWGGFSENKMKLTIQNLNNTGLFSVVTRMVYKKVTIILEREV